jgi:hypothetical protein
MRKVLLFVLPVVLAVIVFLLVIFILSVTSTKKGALQVTSVPQSAVYVNGTMIGKTPLCKCDGQDMIPIGNYTIRLVPTDNTKLPYEEKIAVNQSVLTVVDRTFGEVEKSSGSVITLNPTSKLNTAQFSVVSIPFGASVSMDGNTVGIAPLLLQSITDSDHEVTITKDGYLPKTIRIHGVIGYALKTVVTLAADAISAATASAIQTPLATSSAATKTPQIVILQTPTGFLRVRDAAAIAGAEIAQVHPGEIYQLISEQDGWFAIQLPDKKQGWVTAQYAKKQ